MSMPHISLYLVSLDGSCLFMFGKSKVFLFFVLFYKMHYTSNIETVELFG